MLEFFAVVDGGLLLGLLAASAVSAAGSIYANRQNLKQQKSVNSQAIELADTAHQREVADLYAAGLNPVLSATGNGASVPSLGVANQDNVLSSFGNNARSIGQSLSKTASMQRAEIEAGIHKTVADTDASIATAKNLAKQNDNLVKQNAEIDARIRNIDADTRLKEKEMTSRSPVGRFYEDAKEHGGKVIDSVRDFGSNVISTAKDYYKARHEMSNQPQGVSKRTLDIMEKRGVSPEEVMRRIYEHETKKGRR